jgi:hypothetical protein
MAVCSSFECLREKLGFIPFDQWEQQVFSRQLDKAHTHGALKNQFIKEIDRGIGKSTKINIKAIGYLIDKKCIKIFYNSLSQGREQLTRISEMLNKLKIQHEHTEFKITYDSNYFITIMHIVDSNRDVSNAIKLVDTE